MQIQRLDRRVVKGIKPVKLFDVPWKCKFLSCFFLYLENTYYVEWHAKIVRSSRRNLSSHPWIRHWTLYPDCRWNLTVPRGTPTLLDIFIKKCHAVSAQSKSGSPALVWSAAPNNDIETIFQYIAPSLANSAVVQSNLWCRQRLCVNNIGAETLIFLTILFWIVYDWLLWWYYCYL